MIALLIGILTINRCYPSAFSDENAFFREFLDSDLLSTVGLMASISLATATSIHFALNDLELREQRQLTSTKRAIRRSAVSLIAIFVFSLLLVTLKPNFGNSSEMITYINIAAVIVLLASALIMYDLLMTALSIPGFRR